MSEHQIPTKEGEDESTPGAPRTPKVKRLAPAVPSWYIRRPALEQELGRAGSYRLTSIIAGAGFGKTTHLAACALAHGWAWYTVDGTDASPAILSRGLTAALRERLPSLTDAVVPAGGGGDQRSLADSLAAALAQALEPLLEDDLVLVVDDVHELGDGPAVHLLEGLTRYAPPELHIVLSSRTELPFPVSRLRGGGQVLDVEASQLAFDRDEVAALLSGVVGAEVEELAGLVYEATGGWPAAVQLAAATMAATAPARRLDAADRLVRRRGPLFSYLAEEAFGRESADVRHVVRALAELDRITPRLCEALDLARGEEVLESLTRRGLVLKTAVDSGEPSYSLHALVRQFAREYWVLGAAEVRELQLRAAGWFEEEGMLAEALDALVAARDGDGIARLLSERGLDLTNCGATAAIVRAASLLPAELRTRGPALTIAHAYLVLGDFDEARQWLLRVHGPPDDPYVSMQLALAHIHRAEVAEALATLQAAEAAECGPFHTASIAFQLLWLGRLAEARGYAERALADAASEAATPLSEAHAVLGSLALVEGDLAGAESHLDAAVEIAERIGNRLATVSGRARLAELRLEQGRYTEALEQATRALEQAEGVGFFLFQAGAHSVRGFALLGLGRLDEAVVDFGVGIAGYERIRSNYVAAPLLGVGTVQTERGELALARSSFERAAAAAERSGVASTHVAALAALAGVLVDEDPDEAERLVQAAADVASEFTSMPAVLVGGWIALRHGDRGRAQAAATLALAEATRRGAPPLIAGALELEALSAAEPEAELAPLEEAAAIWSTIGDPVGRAKAELALARLRGSDEGAARAEQALRDLGVRPTGAAAGILLSLATGRREPLAIQTLGRFAVLRDGEAVQVGEWQSRKARQLLRFLVARRGSSVPRDLLMESLWPGEDPLVTSNRLSVALSIVRTVLDPEHRFEPDHYVASTSDGVRLALMHLFVDVEDFLEKADRALRTSAAQGASQAFAQLEEAEASYGGDFLEEDRYEDWAAPLREEARTAYLDVLRALVAASESAGQSSVRYSLRILALDPFDEEAHLGLVSTLSASGRHGEARRAYRRYVERMNEIGVEPAPRPGR